MRTSTDDRVIHCRKTSNFEGQSAPSDHQDDIAHPDDGLFYVGRCYGSHYIGMLQRILIDVNRINDTIRSVISVTLIIP